MVFLAVYGLNIAFRRLKLLQNEMKREICFEGSAYVIAIILLFVWSIICTVWTCLYFPMCFALLMHICKHFGYFRMFVMPLPLFYDKILILCTIQGSYLKISIFA